MIKSIIDTKNETYESGNTQRGTNFKGLSRRLRPAEVSSAIETQPY